MAQSITITIQDDAKAILLLNYFCSRFGYSDTIRSPTFSPDVEVFNLDFKDQLPENPETNPRFIPNPDFDDVEFIPNPETKVAFVKRLTIDWWRGQAAQGKRKEEDEAIAAEFSEANIIID